MKHVEVGFYSTAKYDDGTPVTLVAAANEFGMDVPERPFFRKAISSAPKVLTPVLKANINPKNMVFDARVAGLMGAVMTGHIQYTLTELRDPPNAPATIKAKRSSNPLIDTGRLRSSVTWRIEH